MGWRSERLRYTFAQKRWPASGARVRPDGAAVACGEAGAAASVQPTDI